VIVDDGDIVGAAFVESKADTPLHIDPDAVLAGPIAVKGFEAIAGRTSQLIMVDSNVWRY